MTTAETQTMSLVRRDDGVIVARELQPEVPRTTERVAENLAAVRELAGRQPCPALWDMRGMPRPKPEGWRLFIDRMPEFFVALAILADLETVPVLGAFPSAMDTLLLPVRVFDSEGEALLWIGGFATHH